MKLFMCETHIYKSLKLMARIAGTFRKKYYYK